MPAPDRFDMLTQAIDNRKKLGIENMFLTDRGPHAKSKTKIPIYRTDNKGVEAKLAAEIKTVLL